MPKKTFIISLAIAVFAAGVSVGFILSRGMSPDVDSADFSSLLNIKRIFSSKPTLELVKEELDIINSKYASIQNVSAADLIYGAMEGMMQALGDPHSVFLKPDDSKTFQEDVSGKFEGIGAEIGIRKDVLTVISPLKGNPAERAGLRAGDKITFIDDIETKNLSLDKAVQHIRGPKGTEVTLTILRGKNDAEIKVSIIRDTIKIPILKWEEIDKGIAHISLFHFTETAPDDFANIAQEILQSDIKGIILDVRNNPGGFLETAVDIAGWFLKNGSVVVIEDRGRAGTRYEHKASGSAALVDYPMVILINKGSASASEILAGALRDNRGVTLIGEATFGKGSVQELVHLSDRSSIKITVAKWLTPAGASINDNGLAPDIVIEAAHETENDKQADVQLDKAIEIIKSL